MKDRRRFLPALAGCAIWGAAAVLTGSALADPTPLAATPPMGWNSWNHFADKVSDAVVRAQADAMVSSGLRDAGYLYINIDDTWEGKRDAQGVIHSNDKFPDMKSLADFVHSKGLKLGITPHPARRLAQASKAASVMKNRMPRPMPIGVSIT